MLNKSNLAIHALADSLPTCGREPGILVSDNYTMATDGRVLAIVNRPRSDPNNFPVSPDGVPAKAKQGKFILRIDDAKKLMRAIPKARNMPIFENVMPLEPINGYRRFLVGNPGEMTVYTITPLEQKFQNIKHCWPKDKTKFEISFSVEILEKLLKTIKETSNQNFPVVKFSFSGNESAVKFNAKLNNAQKMTGLIMPYVPKR